MVYKYKGITKQGKKVSNSIEAPTLEDAKKRLQSQGILYEKVSASGETIFTKLGALRKTPLPTKILSNFSRNLSIYLKAGIPILQAIHLQKNDTDHKQLKDMLIAIETTIEEGLSFYQALENQKVVELPTFYTQTIKVAEENGLLDLVLIEMASFLKEQERMVKQVKKAMTYPSIILGVAGVMVAAMLTMVVPKITTMFDQMNKELPAITQFVITSGDVVSAHWLMILLIIVTVIVGFTTLKKRVYAFKFAVDNFMLKMPLFGRLIRTSELARFSYISSMLLRSGVPFVHTARLSANIIENYPIQAKIDKAAQYVVEGKKFSQALQKAGFTFDRSFLQAVALGEETSELPQMLENLALLYGEENQDSTDTFLGLLEPALIIVVGIVMGVIIVAMLLPIVSMDIAG